MRTTFINSNKMHSSHKSYHASEKYTTMQFLYQKLAHMCTFRLQNGALWDMGLGHCGIRATSQFVCFWAVLEKLLSFVDTLGYNAITIQVWWGFYSNGDINSGCYNFYPSYIVDQYTDHDATFDSVWHLCTISYSHEMLYHTWYRPESWRNTQLVTGEK